MGKQYFTRNSDLQVADVECPTSKFIVELFPWYHLYGKLSDEPYFQSSMVSSHEGEQKVKSVDQAHLSHGSSSASL